MTWLTTLRPYAVGANAATTALGDRLDGPDALTVVGKPHSSALRLYGSLNRRPEGCHHRIWRRTRQSTMTWLTTLRPHVVGTRAATTALGDGLDETDTIPPLVANCCDHLAGSNSTRAFSENGLS